MRPTLMIVLTALLLTTACSGSKQNDPAPYQPAIGQVIASDTGSGSVVISLGTRDGVRPGDTVTIVRDGRQVGEIIIHEAKPTQAAGTTAGGSGGGDVRPGDAVIGR